MTFVGTYLLLLLGALLVNYVIQGPRKLDD
jgi:hypothetical protein